MKALCECSFFNCHASFELSDAEIKEFMNRDPKIVLIANDCAFGPLVTDTLIEKRKMYSIYKEE